MLHIKNNPNAKIVLTIGIPTYNRCQHLKRLVKDLISQVRLSNNQQHIEILVSDNFSQDDTEKEIEKHIKNNDDIFISYQKNKKNLGADANCEQLFKNAKGEFVWLMGDDDSLYDSALNIVYDIIIQNKIANVIFVNYKIYDEFREQVIGITNCALEGNKVEITDHNEFYKITDFANSFISSNIIRRDCWNDAMQESYIGTHWIHLFMVRDILLLGPSLVIREPLVKMRGVTLEDSRAMAQEQHPGQYDVYLENTEKFNMFLSELVSKGYQVDLYEKKHKKLLIELIRQVMIYKYTSKKYNIGDLIYTYKWTKYYHGNRILYWIIVVPILFSPVSFWKISFNRIRSVYKWFKYSLIRK